MEVTQQPKSRLLRASLLALAFVALFAASCWLMLNYGLLYLLVAFLIVFGAGYPVLKHFWQRNRGLEYLLFVAAVIGGGALGLNWHSVVALG